jgi:Zn-finger protein
VFKDKKDSVVKYCYLPRKMQMDGQHISSCKNCHCGHTYQAVKTVIPGFVPFFKQNALASVSGGVISSNLD